MGKENKPKPKGKEWPTQVVAQKVSFLRAVHAHARVGEEELPGNVWLVLHRQARDGDVLLSHGRDVLGQVESVGLKDLPGLHQARLVAVPHVLVFFQPAGSGPRRCQKRQVGRWV